MVVAFNRLRRLDGRVHIRILLLLLPRALGHDGLHADVVLFWLHGPHLLRVRSHARNGRLSSEFALRAAHLQVRALFLRRQANAVRPLACQMQSEASRPAACNSHRPLPVRLSSQGYQGGISTSGHGAKYAPSASSGTRCIIVHLYRPTMTCCFRVASVSAAATAVAATTVASARDSLACLCRRGCARASEMP